ncbi:MAG: CRISPR-associated protein Csn1 [Prevotella sp.]|nr:CRISPR-associated protein Csn1 [Prevotella sp.]
MKERILGIDTGTNSIGWAIVDYDCEADENKYKLVDKGVHIFQEGVKIEKGIESSRAAERTGHRRLRIGYWRRKVRKIKLLRILIDNQLCPPLSNEELKRWRSQKQYPLSEAFMAWQRTDENENKNPYYYRNLCLTQKLDLSNPANRYIVGRALYHINQRRGFLSNRKEDTKESNGAVIQGIDEISKAMQECGAEYLGQYFYMLYGQGKKIRTHYTSRLEHYEKELLKICEMQGFSEDLTNKLRTTIITQRPLKSQKHSVGKCVFEPKKPRCPMSHPLYEQYRMYAFINNIKIKGPFDSDFRILTDDEKKGIIPLFLRKSKPQFKFEDISNKLANRKGTKKGKNAMPNDGYSFNFYDDTSVSGCPVTARLSEAFEVKGCDVDEWIDAACEVYTNAGNKTRFEIMNDVWHALFFFEDEDKLKEFAREKLQMDDEHATIFSKIHLPSDYASLSLKAIRKILPYMKQYGMIYSHAVFMANLASVVPCERDDEALLPMLPREDADDIVGAFNEYDPKNSEIRTREEYVKRYVVLKYHLDEDGERKLKNLYHPSMIETFPKVLRETDNGYYQLGSPRTGSMRNPMAMHSLFRIRHVVNTLLKEDKINKDTIIHIEFARELNDANRRAAIRRWQNDKEKERAKYAETIKEFRGKDYEPTDTDILKYQLWEEQEHICLYTGKRISLQDLFDPNKFDIEHTIPRSVGGDSTAMNLTICDSRYNREVKKAQIPTVLANHDEILERIATWKETADDLWKQIRRLNTKGISDKDTKDRIIQKRHRLLLEHDYWKGKYNRFTMTDVPEGFSRRQGVDISIISRYARLYLKSLFPNVYIVKGIATSDFRKIWGLQEEYEKKLRVNHCHHAIDAITIACIGKAEYDKLAQYYHDEEQYHWGINNRRAVFPKPWDTFTEDVKHIEDALLISHYTADNMGKQTRKKQRNKQGKLTGKMITGDTARASLHLDTYYGAIQHSDDEEVRYVVRKPLDTMDPKDVKNIVDDVVRAKVEAAIAEYGSLKEAVNAGIWMNKDKGIKINKVRVYAPMVKNPLHIRKQRDVSKKEYKQQFHVMNDFNYTMGIYVGKDKKGREKRDFVLVNCLDATSHYKTTNSSANLLPEVSPDNNYPLKWSLKIGSMVLLYEKDPQELDGLSNKELCKRLYKLRGLSSMTVNGYHYGTLALLHHQEARSSTEIRSRNGGFKQGEERRSGITMYHTQFNALVEGYDFTMNELGEIAFLHR